MRRSRFHEEFGPVSRWHPAFWVPHFLHRSRDHVVTQYTVTDDQRAAALNDSAFKKWLKLWHFNGVVTGDDRPTKE